jgi:hypothetical protein
MTNRKIFSRLIASVAAVGLVAGCSGGGGKTGISAEKAKQKVAQAEKALDKTRKATEDWGTWKSVIGKLKEARKSLDKGEYKAAYQAAETVKWQSEAGLAQYKKQQDVWKVALKKAKNADKFPEKQYISGNDG